MADEDDLRRAREGETDLAQSDLRQADLSGWDLSGCDLTGAHLEHATARGSNFSNATLNHTKFMKCNANGSDFSGAKSVGTAFSFVDFSECNFRRSVFSRSHFNESNFNGANFSGADFTGAHFLKGTTLEGAYADETTRFDGATVFRPLAREPVFRFYRIERGKLVRLAEAEKPPEDAPPQPLQPEPPAPEPSAMVPVAAETQPARAPSLVVQQRIAQQPREIAVMAAALSLGIGEQIAGLEATKPNEPRALEAYEAYLLFLNELSAGLKDIASALSNIDRSAETVKERDNISRAARIAEELGDKLESWVSGHAQTLIDSGLKTGFLGVGTAFLSFCGVEPNFAFGAIAASLSGQTFMDGIKMMMSAALKRKSSSDSK